MPSTALSVEDLECGAYSQASFFARIFFWMHYVIHVAFSMSFVTCQLGSFTHRCGVALHFWPQYRSENVSVLRGVARIELKRVANLSVYIGENDQEMTSLKQR